MERDMTEDKRVRVELVAPEVLAVLLTVILEVDLLLHHYSAAVQAGVVLAVVAGVLATVVLAVVAVPGVHLAAAAAEVIMASVQSVLRALQELEVLVVMQVVHLVVVAEEALVDRLAVVLHQHLQVEF